MNRRPWAFAAGLFGGMALAARVWAAIQAPQAGQVPVPPDTPVFRAATTLVQFTLVVLDMDGNPVTDLSREEVAVLEDERPREVAFLQSEQAATSATRVEPLPTGVFTNRSEYTPGPPRSITAIVLDAINTPPTSQAEVNAQVLRYLGVSPLEARIALYRLSSRVEVLHDFSEDVESLRARIARNDLQLQPSTVDRGNDVDGLAKDAADEKRQIIAEIVASEQRMVTPYNQELRDRRLAMTLGGLEALGDHLAGIPGRKNLVWVTASMPMVVAQADLQKIYSPFIRSTAQRLATQGIAIYSVDANGIVPIDMRATSIAPGAAKGGPPPRNLLPNATAEGRLWASMDLLSEVTGGRVVKFTNDPTTGIRAATADYRGAYTLGLYPGPASGPDSQWRKVKVQVRRRGVTALHREGYLAVAPAPRPQSWLANDWRVAAATPLGSTAIRVDARGEVTSGTLTVLLQIPSEDLHVRREKDVDLTELEIAIVEKSTTGTFRIRHEPATIRLTTSQPDGSAEPIVRFIKQWDLDKRVSVIRLMVRDRSTGRYGVLDLPLKHIPRS